MPERAERCSGEEPIPPDHPNVALPELPCGCSGLRPSRDGTVDREFQRVQDDPAVPDPGEVSQPEFPSSAAAKPVSGPQLDRREFAELICKTLALILLAAAAVMAPDPLAALLFSLTAWQVNPFNSLAWLELITAGLPVLALLGIGILYWKKAHWIASLMVPDDRRPVAIQPFAVRDAMAVAFSTVGLFFFFDGLREAVAIGFVVQQYSIADADVWYNSRTWTAIAELALSLWLLLGSRGVVGLILWSRTAGTPQHDTAPNREAP